MMRVGRYRKVLYCLPFAASALSIACGSDNGDDLPGGAGSSSGGSASAGGSTGNGSSGGTSSSGNGSVVTTPGPHFPGSGNGFRPLTTGCGPETAGACTGSCEQDGGSDDVTVIRPPATLCYAGEGDNTPDDPAVVIEQVVERKGSQGYVHIRVTFDPAFTDNTYGEGTSSGWKAKKMGPGHVFKDLTGSDHTELLLTDANGETVMHFKVDLISEDASRDCGYGTLSVNGGDGKVLLGDPGAVLAASTSIDRNLNGCGYCESEACASSGDCTVDSPATDDAFTPNPLTPNWDYRQVYEVWVALDAFGDAGFGQAYVTYTHSSPAKGTDTLSVEPTPCPPEWDDPYCPPSVILEGGNCFGGDGSGGSNGSGSGSGGSSTSSGGSSTSSGGSGNGSSGGCPPNEQVWVTSEGASVCTPIPFANYDDMKPCPTGYTLDLASEGQFCVPL